MQMRPWPDFLWTRRNLSSKVYQLCPVSEWEEGSLCLGDGFCIWGFPSCTSLGSLMWTVLFTVSLVISPTFEAGEVTIFSLNVFPLGSDQTLSEAMYNLRTSSIHFQRAKEWVEFLCKLAHTYTSTSSRVGGMNPSPDITCCIQVWLRSYIWPYSLCCHMLGLCKLGR